VLGGNDKIAKIFSESTLKWLENASAPGKGSEKRIVLGAESRKNGSLPQNANEPADGKSGTGSLRTVSEPANRKKGSVKELQIADESESGRLCVKHFYGVSPLTGDGQ
jgi:hypothetical protein